MARVVEESFEERLKRIRPKLKRLISRYGVPPEDVEDLLQQSLLAFLHKQDTVRNTETWLVGTVRRQCLMYFRSHRRRLYDAVDSAVLDLVADSGLPNQERTEMMCDLKAAMARISPRCRTVLRLRYRLGYKPAEVASRLGYQPSSIRTITNRCLAALTRELALGGAVDKGASVEKNGPPEA